jgi:predicted transposase YbfD/YdcC
MLATLVAGAPSQAVCESFAIVARGLLKRSRLRPWGRPSNKELPDIISIDGKSAAKAIRSGDAKTTARIVDAVFKCVPLAVRRVYDKSNEITANPMIVGTLASLGLVKGRIPTLDAMGCQKDLAPKITGVSPATTCSTSRPTIPAAQGPALRRPGSEAGRGGRAEEDHRYPHRRGSPRAVHQGLVAARSQDAVHDQTAKNNRHGPQFGLWHLRH